MADRSYTRRGFLLTLGAAGAAAGLAACGGRTDTTPTTQPADQIEGRAGIVAAECPGYDQLTEDDLSVRRTLNYVDQTPVAGQYCYNCRFVIDNGQWGECQGCQLFAGPVAPEGWCSSWASMT